MEHSQGRKRVIISNITPRVEEGAFSAKRVLNEEVVIGADIFSDGHDEVGARVFYKHENSRNWKEVPMEPLVNDRWQASFWAEKLGFYDFKVQGWIDHFATWKKDLKKKFEANQDISVDLLIGAEMLEKAADGSKDRQGNKILEKAEVLRKEKHQGSGVALALSDELTELLENFGEKPFASTYPRVYRVEVERKKALFSTWYELFPRSASPDPKRAGTFKDVAQLLPRIAQMGFDTLYFPPIHPIGEKNRKGKNNALKAGPGDPGSPWAIGSKDGGHKSIHPELGTLQDLKNLINEAQKYDIEIALDLAFQCAPDHPWVKEHPQWFKWRPDGTVQYAENPPKKYEDILPLNFESEDWQGLWHELKSVVDYWIDQGITIFRVDNPHTKAFPFWEWMIDQVRKKHPEVIFLAEAFTRPRVMERLGKIGFNQSYTYFTWRNTKYELETYMDELVNSELRDYFRPNFWPNTPDILPPILTHGGEPAHIMRLVLAATLSSNYGVYGPVYEFGFNTPHPKKEEYIDNEKYEIKHWEWSQYTRIKEIMARVNKIRKENRALHTTWNIYFADTQNDQILCFGKADPETGNILIVAVNLDPYHVQGSMVRIPVRELGIDPGHPYMVRDLISGDKYHWQHEWNYVQLNPHQMPAHIFRVDQ